jgi:hypothetical protein
MSQTASIDLFAVAVELPIRQLNNLVALLDKGIEHVNQTGMDPKTITEGRLAADMLPFTRQISIVSDTAKGAAARLAGVEIPKYEDTETTLPELRQRLLKTLDFLRTFTREQINGAESRPITMKLPSRELHFSGQDYLLNFALPNLSFHVVVAYAILRHVGVPVGKMDYLGTFPSAT